MLKILAFAALTFTPAAALACTISVNGPGYAMIDVLGGNGRGRCDLKKFPKPWNSLLGIKQGTSRAFHWAYEEKQHAYVMFDINKNGKGTVTFHYTNDKQVDGDTFVSYIVLQNAKGEDIGFISSQRGVNAQSAGSDRKKVSESPEYWASVRYLQFSYSYVDTGDDQAIWDAARAAASAAACAYAGVCIGG